MAASVSGGWSDTDKKMQVTETSATGLKRELKVVIDQGELGERFQSRLDEVKDQVQI